ncbi:hypothetical protein AMTRI_Chr06g192640 [Amborella trichopoda]
MRVGLCAPGLTRACIALIRAQLVKGQPEHALLCYARARAHGHTPSPPTLALALKASRLTGHRSVGAEAHATSIKLGLSFRPSIFGSLIAMYACSFGLDDARKLFDEMIQRKDEEIHKPHYSVERQTQELLHQMTEIDTRELLEDERGNHGLLEDVCGIHGSKLFDGVNDKEAAEVVGGNAMIAGYARAGCISEAMHVFEAMPIRDTISYNSIISACNRAGNPQLGISLFRQMQAVGLKPDCYSIAISLSSCANLGALNLGIYVHNCANANAVPLNHIVGAALIDMYAKCGSIDMSLTVFSQAPRAHVSAWNAIIGGLAAYGRAHEALNLFTEMQREGVEPDTITFTNILTACSHCGLVDEGLCYFDRMSKEFGLTPEIQHYGSIIDMLGRSGLLKEAQNFIESMPLKPDLVLWRALLSACRNHGEVDFGEGAIDQILNFRSKDSGDYVLISKLYSSLRMWDKVEKVWKVMKKKGIKKNPGLSCIEINGEVHEFLSGDRLHPFSDKIYRVLDEVMKRLKANGFEHETGVSMIDVLEEEKEEMLGYHSEKLAVAFGLLTTSPRSLIRVVKNLRICHDCHSAIKMVSRIFCREIVVRDRLRFHCFNAGYCSCNDHW